MNNTLQAARVGLFFLLGSALIYTVYTVIGNQRVQAARGFAVTAVFNDLKTLTPGADVRIAGVRVGEVESTALVKGRGEILLRLVPGTEVPADSVAKIAVASLLGQNYIAIEYGQAAGRLADGATIRTKETADLGQVVEKVGELGDKLNKIADGFNGDPSKSPGALFANLNDMVQDNRSRIDSLLTNLDQISSKLNQGQGTLGRLINDEDMYNELMGTVSEIKAAAKGAQTTMDEARLIFTDVRQGKGTLGMLLYDDTIGKDLQATMGNFRTLSDKLATGEGTLGKLVNDDEMYYQLQGLLKKADEALDSLNTSGPISAVGTAAGAVF